MYRYFVTCRANAFCFMMKIDSFVAPSSLDVMRKACTHTLYISMMLIADYASLHGMEACSNVQEICIKNDFDKQ